MLPDLPPMLSVALPDGGPALHRVRARGEPDEQGQASFPGFWHDKIA